MSSTSTVRLSELVATLSLVSDLGMGRPVEHVLRQTVIAMRLAELAEAPDDLRAATYYTSLLTWVGCATETSDLAELFGDETTLYSEMRDGGDLAGMHLAVFMLRHLGRGNAPVRRINIAGQFMASGGRAVREIMVGHCQSAGVLADRLGLGATVKVPLLQAFERWDGKGVPGDARRDDLSLVARLVQLADCVEACHFAAGSEAALKVARERRGTHFDPDLVDRFCDAHGSVLAGIDEVSAWDEVIALDPSLGVELSDDELDNALEALADFADLKSPCRAGHSRGVAATAAAAADALGLGPAAVQLIRRAALVHDVGVIGVSSTVWNETKPWTVSQRERARTHPYLLERMLAQTPLLRQVAQCAGLHHERLDGSGYPRGLRGDALPLAARIVAAADVHNALGQPRPHRAAVDDTRVAEILRDEVRAGRLDGQVVNAVLQGSGQRVRRRAELPGGLTPREVSVLVCVARGRSNPEIAQELTISRKTVSSHLEHIYTKLGVSSRTEAALFAMQHGFVDSAPA
jgi:HD-GYP domain-containing protein (c-di-GMP phosphodiesterase class II)